MQKQEHLNTFHKGQIQDVDNLQLSNESYLKSENGRVIFNEDGTYAWENANGTKFAFIINANYGGAGSYYYKPIGGWQINGKLCIFSVSETDGHSEIGLVYEPQFGTYTYQTIFNDIYDPYGGLLNFSLKNQIRDCQTDVENNKTERVYFNDDFNEPRVFNVLLGLTSVSPQFTNGNYNPLLATGKYPPFYSVHGMANMIDLTWGKLKYQNSNIVGNLLSGEYQYAYRYIHQTGYSSPWSPLTGHVFLTTDKTSSDWTQYQMQQSGAQTSKGIQLELKYIDQRFQQIEVAALYWETESQPKNAYIFFKGTIGGSTMTIQHQNTGSTITVDELVQRYTEIKSAKTGNQKDNTYHLANLTTFPQLQINTRNITVIPQVRPMLSDETKNEVATTLTPPFTNQQIKNVQVTENLAANLPEVYDIQADYINYKGTQWTTIFKGLFGGEIYPLAIVVFDRKGQPFFAQHIADFTPPQRYSNQWIDTRLDSNGVQVITTGTTGAVGDYKHTNNANGTVIIDNNGGTPVLNSSSSGDDLWYLNLIGLKLSGIDFTNILYDSDGKLQVSGFSIVRTDRIKQILGQGLVMTACSSRNNANTKQFIFPCPTMFNGYIQNNGYPYGAGAYDYEASPYFQYVGVDPRDYSPPPNLPALANKFAYVSGCGGGGCGTDNTSNPIFSARTDIATFECPDFMIDSQTLTSRVAGDNMKFVNVCVKAYSSAPSYPILAPNSQAPLNLTHNSYYQKNYRTTLNNILTSDTDNDGVFNGATFGDVINIDNLYPNVQNDQVVFGNLYYNNAPSVQQYLDFGLNRFIANQIRPTCLFTFGYNVTQNRPINSFGVLTDDEFGNASAGIGAYMITNYIRPVGSTNITPSLLENRVYYNTGHFVPINQDILNTLFAAQGNYIFNDVSVWGGDCFLDYWTYQRLYPHLQQVNGDNQDYGIGLSFPIESVYNIALRQGNTLERLGAEPAASYNSPPGVFQSGIYYFDSDLNKPETFDVNSVLQAKDTTDLYPAQPSTFVAIYDYPVREQYTGTKIYGEQYDTYRKFPINNFRDAEGNKGEINSLQYIFNYLYIIQRNGFARVRFNDREMITGQTGSSLDIGNALGLAGFDYISPIYGSQHQFSVVNSGKAIYFIDSEKGKFLRFAADGMLSPSDEYGMHTYITNKSREYWTVLDTENILYPTSDKPYYDSPLYAGGITGVYDYVNQSYYATFTQRKQSQKATSLITVGIAETLEYSEQSNQFKSFHSFTPKLYMNFKQAFFSSDPSNQYQIYSHNEGIKGQIYGVYYHSKLKFVVNPFPTEAKWIDNGSIAINNQISFGKIYSVSVFTENQIIQTINFPTDSRPRYLQGLVRYPLRALNALSRMRGKSAIVEIDILNDASNTTVRISNHMTDVRISPKV